MTYLLAAPLQPKYGVNFVLVINRHLGWTDTVRKILVSPFVGVW